MSALPDRLAARVWPFIPLASHAPVPRSEYSHEEFSHWNATWKQLHLRDPMGARYAPVRALISDTDPGGRVLHFTGPRKPWLPEQHLSSLCASGSGNLSRLVSCGSTWQQYATSVLSSAEQKPGRNRRAPAHPSASRSGDAHDPRQPPHPDLNQKPGAIRCDSSSDGWQAAPERALAFRGEGGAACPREGQVLTLRS